MTDEELSKYCAYTNGIDFIIGTSLSEAISSYCAEIGIDVSEYDSPSKFLEVPVETAMIIVDEDSCKIERKLISEWIRIRLTLNSSRLIMKNTNFLAYQ